MLRGACAFYGEGRVETDEPAGAARSVLPWRTRAECARASEYHHTDRIGSSHVAHMGHLLLEIYIVVTLVCATRPYF